jgi:taurine dioxygenase
MNIQLSDRVIGAIVTGVSLKDISDREFEMLRDLIHERSVVVIKGQELSEEDQVKFARRFGELQHVFIKDALLTNFPELFCVSNIFENGKPIGSTDAGIFWHTDGACFEKPHALSMLYSVEVPHEGTKPLGDTNFIGMGAAYDALSFEMKQRIGSLRALHSLHHRYEKAKDASEVARQGALYPPASHPLMVAHPVTGRRCLYLSEGYTTCVEGLPENESAALLDDLRSHVVRPEFRYSHSWAVGDLLIWDNIATLHKATFDYALPQRRLMRRATVSGASLG